MYWAAVAVFEVCLLDPVASASTGENGDEEVFLFDAFLAA
jgi:hypothetical protein